MVRVVEKWRRADNCALVEGDGISVEDEDGVSPTTAGRGNRETQCISMQQLEEARKCLASQAAVIGSYNAGQYRRQVGQAPCVAEINVSAKAIPHVIRACFLRFLSSN